MKDTPMVVTNAVDPDMNLVHRIKKLSTIDEGGMGIISLVKDQNLNRIMVEKRILTPRTTDPTLRVLLIEEAQITAQLDHPNITPVHELGIEKDGALFFTMKFVEGRTLENMLEKTGPSLRNGEVLFELLQIFTKVLDAIAFAHSKGVLHRDLKPANVMVGSFGQVYVMDWGIAMLKAHNRISQLWDKNPKHATGYACGTPNYMSPEQAKGQVKTMDQRTDIFALGGILYEILTDFPPYYDDDPDEVFRMAGRGLVVDVRDRTHRPLPDRLCAIAMKALQPGPDHRYQSVAEMKKDVDDFMRSAFIFEQQRFEPGQCIIRQGDPGDTAYIITDGRVRVTRTEDGVPQFVAELATGDVFGEMAVFGNRPRSATVTAVTPTVLRMVTAQQFKEHLGLDSWMKVFVKALTDRFAQKDLAESFARKSMQQQELVLSLYRLMALHGVKQQDGSLTAPWSTLADHLTRHHCVAPMALLDALAGRSDLCIDAVADIIRLRP